MAVHEQGIQGWSAEVRGMASYQGDPSAWAAHVLLHHEQPYNPNSPLTVSIVGGTQAGVEGAFNLGHNEEDYASSGVSTMIDSRVGVLGSAVVNHSEISVFSDEPGERFNPGAPLLALSEFSRAHDLRWRWHPAKPIEGPQAIGTAELLDPHKQHPLVVGFEGAPPQPSHTQELITVSSHDLLLAGLRAASAHAIYHLRAKHANTGHAS